MKNNCVEKTKLSQEVISSKAETMINNLAVKYDYIKDRDALIQKFNEIYTEVSPLIKNEGDIKKLETALLEILKKNVSALPQKKLNDTIIKYIDKIMFSINNLDDFNRFFKIYTNFFLTFGIENTEEISSCVLQSGKLDEVLEYYISNYKDAVTSGKFYELFTNSIIVSFIELYALKNKIEINAVEIDESDARIDSSIDDIKIDENEEEYQSGVINIDETINDDEDDTYFKSDNDYLLEDEEAIEEEKEEEKEEDLLDDDKLLDGYTGDDPVKMYLTEIGKVPLLTDAEEKEYGKAVYVAHEYLYNRLSRMTNREDLMRIVDELDIDAIENIIKNGNFTDKDIKRIHKAINQFQLYRSKMASANLRLVVSIAKRYVGRGLLFLDLIQEGNLGLLKSIAKYNYKKGYRFSTYATWWIRQSITRSIADKGRTVRIPVHMVETINKLVRETERMVVELGREPTIDELVERTGMDKDRIVELQKYNSDPVSIYTYIGDDQDSELIDFIPDENTKIEENYMKDSMAALVRKQLDELYLRHSRSGLKPKEYIVLRYRFNIRYPEDMKIDENTDHLMKVIKEYEVTNIISKPLTLEDTAVVLYEILCNFKEQYPEEYASDIEYYIDHAVTRERVRQIEAKAIRKLRRTTEFRTTYRDYENEDVIKNESAMYSRPTFAIQAKEQNKVVDSKPLFRENQYHKIIQEEPKKSLYEVPHPTARDKRDAIKVTGIKRTKTNDKKKKI